MRRIPVPQRRAALIQAALRVIAEHGVAAATTRAIAAEAGMSLASVHYAFASRDELIANAIAYVVEESAQVAEDALPEGADLATTLRAGLLGYVAGVIADPPREQAMFELNQYALRTPGLEHAAKEQYAAYHRVAVEVLTAVAEHAGCEWTLPMPQMARILITLTDGITFAWLVDRDTDAAEKVIDFAAEALARLGTKR